MLVTLAIVLAILVTFMLLGYPLIEFFFNGSKPVRKIDSIITLAFSLIIGFGISALASATAYGFTGINSYFQILLLILIINWTFLLVKKKNNLTLLSNFKASDIFLFIPLFLSTYFSSSQWTSLSSPAIKVGTGPDVSQNLMAAQSADSVGSTWFEALKSLQNFLNVDSFEQAAMNQFRVPSVSDVASYDYLVFGSRWGLTVPFNQLTKLFGPELILRETSIVLLLSLLSCSLVFYAIGKVFSQSFWFPAVLSASIISNASFLYQFLNGGLAQSIGAISLSGLLLVFILIVKDDSNESSKNERQGLFIVSMCSWMGSLVSYIDSVFVIGAALVTSTIILFFTNKGQIKKLIIIIFCPGVIALVLLPIFAYQNFINLSLRIKAASGTGFYSDRWSIPTEQFGFINSYSTLGLSKFSRTISLSIFLLVVWVLFRSFLKIKTERALTSIALGALIVIGIGYYFSSTSNQKSSYIYEKVSLYLAPFIITVVYVLLKNTKSTRKFNYAPLILVSLTITCIASGIHFQETYFKSARINSIPYGLASLMNDKKLQDELSKVNYLMPYKPEYNYMGILGAKYWISKAPNDFILDERINNELRLLCFSLDEGCKPLTERIINIDLDKYGIYQYASPISTAEFKSLTIDERFDINFEAFGLPIEEVPEKFKGGNPYFK